MKNIRKSSPYFGPRSKMSSKLVLRVRKPRNRKSRFVSPIMKKFDEELKKQKNVMRTIGTTNQVVIRQQAKQSPSARNIVQSKGTTMRDHLGPSARNVTKSNHSLATTKHTNDLTLKDGNCSNYSTVMSPSRKLNKGTTSRSTNKSNRTLGPRELSHQSRRNEGLVHIPNCPKRSCSQTNHLKAMPGLVHNKKNQSNIDQGGAMGTQNKGGHCGTKERKMEWIEVPGEGKQCESESGIIKDKTMRCKPLPDLDSNIARKRRKYIETNDGVDDSSDQGNHQSDEVHHTRSPSHDATLKVCHAEVSQFVSNVAQQYDYCSVPIDEPAWSGILKIGKNDYVSLAGHLSTKSGKQVWNVSRSLGRVVAVSKVCRSEVWPKSWEASGPTSDNIGMYFFSYKMRPDKYFDQLIKEAMENDLALRATIDEAEMLIFPSSLLPERYQMFQSKHYLWGVFRPTVVEGKYGDESRHVENTTEEATAVTTNATTSHPAGATAVATNPFAVPTETPMMGTKAHTVPTNGRIDSSMGAQPGRVVSFVARKTARVEQLIHEMEREGALIFAMQGEMIAGDVLGSQQGDCK